jgi:hypothetical protein
MLSTSSWGQDAMDGGAKAELGEGAKEGKAWRHCRTGRWLVIAVPPDGSMDVTG